MALYLGGDKLKIRLDNSIRKIIVPVSSQSTGDTRQASLDKYILKDSNEAYITEKEE